MFFKLVILSNYLIYITESTPHPDRLDMLKVVNQDSNIEYTLMYSYLLQGTAVCCRLHCMKIILMKHFRNSCCTVYDYKSS